MSKLKLEQVVITPKLASEMLTRNVGNRKPKWNRIAEYGRLMEEGKFTVSTDCIGFDSNGRLINGQNRLMACVRSNCSFEAIVAKGFEPRTFKVLDQGAARSTTDIAKDEAAYIRSGTSIAVVKFLMCRVLKRHDSHVMGKMSCVEATIAYDGIAKFAYHIANMRGSLSRTASTTAAMIAAIANGVSIETIYDFVRVGKNEISSNTKYNNKAALDYINYKAGKSSESGQDDVYEEGKKAIYLFANNIRRTGKSSIYPINDEDIEAINDIFKTMNF